MPRATPRLRVAVVTGSRAEFGLLVPVIRAIKAHKRLRLQLIAAGSHFLAPARTIREVESMFPIAARVPMQRPGHRTRLDDASATARGIDGFARAFARLKPDWVVVLGDRIEAFAAASAAAIAGIAVAHIHGGDRAEGIADESMRHAITKLAHLHLAATKQSGERIVKMGERPESVHAVGSPAMDGLRAIKAMNSAEAAKLGEPLAVFLLHPSGLDADTERAVARHVLGTLNLMLIPTLILAPNHDAGRGLIVDQIEYAMRQKLLRFPMDDPRHTDGRKMLLTFREHLPRPVLLSLFKRLRMQRRTGTIPYRGFLIGNSSAGLLEAAAIGLPVVNIGPRQAGRERAKNVIDVPLRLPLEEWAISVLEDSIAEAMLRSNPAASTVWGDGCAGPRIARLLAGTDPHDPALLRKRNSY